MNDPIIDLRHVSKAFTVHTRTDATMLSRMADLVPSGHKRNSTRRLQALSDVSLQVNQGEVLGIIGKNASGKSTLLRIIAGILHPDEGSASVQGTVTSLMNLSAGLRHRLTIIDNIFLACSLYGMQQKDIRNVVSSIIEFAGIQAFTDMYPYQLSSGMSQRLAFSIAIHTSPEILLLDEVFSAGDMAFKNTAKQRMEALIRSSVTVVIVSHDMSRIRGLCDRVIWLENGKIVKIGPVEDIIKEYEEYCEPSVSIDTSQCHIKNDTDINECIAVHGGLGDLQKKLSSQQCTIAYMGSSVTAQGNGFRPYLHKSICDVSQQEHKEINAGIGGVTSMTGLFLMQKKILDHHPDVCFFDYSISDSNQVSLTLLRETLETIIRKLLAINCQICIIHSHLRNFQDIEHIRKEYNMIAERYHIPIIDAGCILRKEFASREKTHEQIFRDDAHTDETKDGGKYLAEKIFPAFCTILQSIPLQSNMTKIQKEPLHCKDSAIQQIHLVQKEHIVYPNHMLVGHFQEYAYIHIDSHNTIEFSFVGEIRGILYVAGPESGIIQVTYKEESREYSLWGPHCHFERFNTMHIHPIVSDGSSPVRIKVTEKPIDYSLCRREIPNVDTLQKSIKIIGYMVQSV